MSTGSSKLFDGDRIWNVHETNVTCKFGKRIKVFGSSTTHHWGFAASSSSSGSGQKLIPRWRLQHGCPDPLLLEDATDRAPMLQPSLRYLVLDEKFPLLILPRAKMLCLLGSSLLTKVPMEITFFPKEVGFQPPELLKCLRRAL